MNYKSLPSHEILMTTLRKTLNTAWNINTIHETGINKWLSNFVGDALCTKDFEREKAKDVERRIALFLLCNYIYYNEQEVKHLMKVMLEKYIHNYFSNHSLAKVNDNQIDSLIRGTQFSPLGNQSESSSYMLYLFRQINDLSKYDFEEKKDSENIVFVDDFSITGNQSVWYIKKYMKEHPKKKFQNLYVLLMISTREAINKISSIPAVKEVLPCIIIDNSSKAFSDESIIFQGYSPELKEQAKKICLHYGELILSKEDKENGCTAFGFGGGEYLLGTYYNTPNNTLPIFWAEENLWQPIFTRYNKKYTSDSKVRLGGQYV